LSSGRGGYRHGRIEVVGQTVQASGQARPPGWAWAPHLAGEALDGGLAQALGLDVRDVTVQGEW
jgi:hypothetical protein